MLLVVLLLLIVNVVTIRLDLNWHFFICFIVFMSFMFFYFLTELVAFLIAMGEKCPAKAIK